MATGNHVPYRAGLWVCSGLRQCFPLGVVVLALASWCSFWWPEAWIISVGAGVCGLFRGLCLTRGICCAWRGAPFLEWYMRDFPQSRGCVRDKSCVNAVGARYCVGGLAGHLATSARAIIGKAFAYRRLRYSRGVLRWGFGGLSCLGLGAGCRRISLCA